MSQSLEDAVLDLISPYFPQGEVARILDTLRQWTIDETCLFYQVGQYENKPTFEIAFRDNSLLVDFTHRTGQSTLSVLRIDTVASATLKDLDEATEMAVAVAGPSFGSSLIYRASAEASRKALRSFFGVVRGLLESRTSIR